MIVNIEQRDRICDKCGRYRHEYDVSWPCKKNHDWRHRRHMAQHTKKYQKYLKKKHKSQVETHRRRLDKLNKTTPKEYAIRHQKHYKDRV